jgi:hypothetical protein
VRLSGNVRRMVAILPWRIVHCYAPMRQELNAMHGGQAAPCADLLLEYVLRLANPSFVVSRAVTEAGWAASQRDPERGRFRFGRWQLDRRIWRLVDPAGAQVTLTKGEYALLTAFLDAPQRPLSREQLLQATRVHEDIFDRSVDVQILRLRRKLKPNASAPRTRHRLPVCSASREALTSNDYDRNPFPPC